MTRLLPDPELLRSSCRRTLSGWSGPTAEQHGLARLYLQHLERHPDGWSRRCRGAHLTASSLICVPEQQKVLLTLHARIGRWLQTGGHLEPGDVSLAAAALREAAEESGLVGLALDPVPLLLSRHRLLCSGEETYHLDVQFLVTASAAAPPVMTPESLQVRWFATSALPDVDLSVTELVRAAGARLGWTSGTEQPSEDPRAQP